MSTKQIYKTKQREILIQYLEQVPGVHITVNDVCEHCRAVGAPIGQTTVYRQLEKMVDEGLVNKYTIDGSSAACFEYVPDAGTRDQEQCFHCKCEKCGKLIHLHCEELALIGEHLRKSHSFYLNPMRTVFYGLCEDCAGEGSHE